MQKSGDCYHPTVNNTHQKTLALVFADPVKGTVPWSRIEVMLKALGCSVTDGKGSAATFESDGRKLTVHRPHPGKEALRYRVLAVRDFLVKIGVTP